MMTARDREIIAGYRKGASLRELGFDFTLSYEGIRKILRKYGVKRRPIGTPGRRWSKS